MRPPRMATTASDRTSVRVFMKKLAFAAARSQRKQSVVIFPVHVNKDRPQNQSHDNDGQDYELKDTAHPITLVANDRFGSLAVIVSGSGHWQTSGRSD